MGSQSVPLPRTVTGVIGTSPRRSDRWAIPMCVQFEGFDGDRGEILIASSLEEGFGIGPVGFVSLAVASHMGGRKQRDLMAEGLELASPVMSRAAGLHQDVSREVMQEEGPEALAREPVLLIHATRSMGHSDLEDRFCEIHGDLGSLHEDSSPLIGLRGRS